MLRSLPLQTRLTYQPEVPSHDMRVPMDLFTLPASAEKHDISMRVARQSWLVFATKLRFVPIRIVGVRFWFVYEIYDAANKMRVQSENVPH